MRPRFAHEIRPLPLSAHRLSAPAPLVSGAADRGQPGVGPLRKIMAIEAHRVRTRSSTAASSRSIVSPYFNRASTTRVAIQYLIQGRAGRLFMP